MHTITLSRQELACLTVLLKELATRCTTVESHDFLKDVGIFAHEMPRRLRVFLNDFRVEEPRPGICLISGYPVSDAKIGRTPRHWNTRTAPSPALEEEILLLMFGSLLGEALAWSTQQNGHLVHDVFPIEGLENEQLGNGSEQTLWWHTEDAFHPYRSDYLGMMCLRNPDRVATTVASISAIQLDPALARVLFEPRYTIRPDESHLIKNGGLLENRKADDQLEAAYERINHMNQAPKKIAVLHGSLQSPYVRIDPYFMDPLQDDYEGLLALNALIATIDEHLENLVFSPGDIVFLDNYRVVHGRRPFKARYDGSDRWLKRINVTRDLRKSRAARLTCTSRVIY